MGAAYNRASVRRVIKFGGTSIATPELIARAARAIAERIARGDQVAVVVSAMGDETDRLIRALEEVGGEVPVPASYEVVLSGEERSVRLMVAALRAQGVRAEGFSPTLSSRWPLVVAQVEEVPLTAEKVNQEVEFVLDREESRRRALEHLLPLMRAGGVPVITGWFVLDRAGRLFTLGRGGSDISAVLVARLVEAGEVVMVTDAAGIMTGDPRKIEGARTIEELSSEEVRVIVGSGARVIHPKALALAPSQLQVRVVDYRELSRMLEGGTRISPAGEEEVVWVDSRRLSMVTVVGEGLSDRAGVLAHLARKLAEEGISICYASVSDSFINLYLEEGAKGEALSLIHSLITTGGLGLTSVSERSPVGHIRLRSSDFIEQPGILAEVSSCLANRRINILEVITALTDIHLFVSLSDLSDSAELLQSLFVASPG